MTDSLGGRFAAFGRFEVDVASFVDGNRCRLGIEYCFVDDLGSTDK